MLHPFVGVAPIDNPQVVVLVTLYNPTGEGGHQGGGVAAPIAGQVLGEVLPYLEIQKQETEESIIEEVTMPNITGLSIAQLGRAKQVKADKENTIIQEQIPVEGVKVNKGSKIIVIY